jgi:prepilin-type processing-associated H-X9-DG protein
MTTQRCCVRTRRGTRSSRRRRGITYVEVLVIVLVIVFLVAIFLPIRQHPHRTANRVKCASNLRQIGQAILLYSNENHGAYPRTYAKVPEAGVIITPTWGTGAGSANPFGEHGPADNDVSAALFLLLRTQDITSEVFTCPSSNAEKDLYGGGTNAATNRSNFTSVKQNLSYSYQNPYPNAAAIERKFVLTNQVGAEFAVAADINPGTANGKNVLKPIVTSSAAEMKQANSNNHDGDGQNILYGDGHVSWESNPFAGVNRDNIYTRFDGKTPTSGNDVTNPFGSSYDGNDSVLLPTDD